MVLFGEIFIEETFGNPREIFVLRALVVHLRQASIVVSTKEIGSDATHALVLLVFELGF